MKILLKRANRDDEEHICGLKMSWELDKLARD